MAHGSPGKRSLAHKHQVYQRCPQGCPLSTSCEWPELPCGSCAAHVSSMLQWCWAALASQVALQAWKWLLNRAAAPNFIRQCRDVHETSAVTVPGDGGKTRWRRGRERLSSPCGTVLHWVRWMPLQAALSLLRRDRFSCPKWVHLLSFQLAKGIPHQPPRGYPHVLPCPSGYLHESLQMPARTSAP